MKAILASEGMLKLHSKVCARKRRRPQRQWMKIRFAGDVLGSGAGLSSYSGQSTLPSVGSREAALARQQQLQQERARARMGGSELLGVSILRSFWLMHTSSSRSCYKEDIRLLLHPFYRRLDG